MPPRAMLPLSNVERLTVFAVTVPDVVKLPVSVSWNVPPAVPADDVPSVNAPPESLTYTLPLEFAVRLDACVVIAAPEAPMLPVPDVSVTVPAASRPEVSVMVPAVSALREITLFVLEAAPVPVRVPAITIPPPDPLVGDRLKTLADEAPLIVIVPVPCAVSCRIAPDVDALPNVDAFKVTAVEFVI